MQAGEEAAATMCPPWAHVRAVYDAAQRSGAATKLDTRAQVARDGGIDFVLRVASALRAKPSASASASASGSAGAGAGASANAGGSASASAGAATAAAAPVAPNTTSPPAPAFNPFLPYEEALWCGHLSRTHTLLLNKFNVVPKHVLVVTRAFESQRDPLNAGDLAATRAVLATMPPPGGVAFYNCGAHSGRSQPHKHVQVVPLPFHDDAAGGSCSSAQADGGEEGEDSGGPPMSGAILAAAAAAGAGPLQPFAVRSLPFRAYAALVEPNSTPGQLEAAAAALLALCRPGVPLPPGEPDVSYNAVLAPRWLLYVPRRRECCGRIAINALGFAGTVLLKSDEDLARALELGPLAMLAEVGVPWETEPPHPSNAAG